MTHDAITPKYHAGDVVIGERLHANTSKPLQDNTNQGPRKYIVEGKSRPMLILKPMDSKKRREYPSLDFTTRMPRDDVQNYLLKANGAPRSFGPSMGFDEPCFLKIYPLEKCHEDKMKSTDIPAFNRGLMAEITRQCAARFLSA